MTEESLQRKLARLESALDTERARLRKACDKIPWGAGMRRTKCTPSFRRENELIEKIKVVKLQLSQVNPEKPDVPLNKNDAFQKVQKRHVQEKR